MIMFTSMVQSTWEIILIAPIGGLLNGGLAGLFWGYIWTFIGFVFIVMSLAEMASMAPTSGGQYHWCVKTVQSTLQGQQADLRFVGCQSLPQRNTSGYSVTCPGGWPQPPGKPVRLAAPF
jgi:amino acid transporter